MSLTLAIVGRPNVGKSTLFNRLVGKALALVEDRPGVTRDRREAEARLGDLPFRLIDTAGLAEAPPDSLASRMLRQTESAVDGADAVLMLIDGRAGVTADDEHFADWLRRSDLPVVLVANKCEGAAGEDGLLEAWSLGLGEPVAVSAAHGEGLADLFQRIAAIADGIGDETGVAAGEAPPLQLAILGRPNAGKSTLVNRLIGQDRLVTGAEPGITRDAISIAWSWRGQPVKLIDTAGLRKRARIVDSLEKMSVDDALRAMDFAHVVVLLCDAEDAMERQDLTIARRAIDQGRGLVIAVNKWDLVAERAGLLRAVTDRLRRSLPQAGRVPIVTLSALTGERLDRLMPTVFEVHRRWNSRVPTGALNRWLDGVLSHHPPPLGRTGRPIRLRYVTQAKSRPPTFALFCNLPDELPDSYRRYLQNSLREDFDLDGVPIRILTRKPRNPYDERRRR